MAKLKVLYICHNHPSVHPGGSEGYALELYEAMRASSEFEPVFLARIGSNASHPGTPFSAVNKDENQYFVHTNAGDFDWLYLTAHNKEIYTRHFHEFLLAHQPDIIHFQHTCFLGFDLLRQVKNTLPDVPIVYTLHEFLPICHRNGQMLRRHSNELCSEESPRRCHECFPDISPQRFFMRKRFIQSQLSVVDLFLSPSHFLLERYVEWGIPPDKIRYEPNGRLIDHSTLAEDVQEQRPRNRIGFFGQFNLFKGVNVLMNAMRVLKEEKKRAASLSLAQQEELVAANGTADVRTADVDAHLWLHGANLEVQPQEFQDEFNALLKATKRNVTLVGRYEQADLPKLMANIDWVVMPSIWWENSPLVIQEAFLHKRPIICSDIGGMAEKVTHGVNGLHFRARDTISLAETIRYAVGTPGLWETLRAGIPEVYKIEDHVATLSNIYYTLLARKANTEDTVYAA